MDQDGNTLDSSVKNRREEERNLYALADKMAEGQETHVWAALADGERIRFAYEGGHGQSFGNVVPIGSTVGRATGRPICCADGRGPV